MVDGENFNGEIKKTIGCLPPPQISNLFICFIFRHNIFAADKEIHDFKFFVTNNKYSNQVYFIILRIKNKKTLIWYCSA